jgi:tetratricopeptide (TPR) repeat protein
VYFYFSGHGDMENSTIYKLGFLISYNTPRTNYINNAVRIEDLNNYANTLSVKTKAKVILITDACHSGNLAGNDFKGSLLVGEQLKKVINNEIRISSCAPDQLSVEDKKWGGGRGVFSYYLLNGLKGLADDKQDGTISVKEISNYLQTSLSNDPVLKERKHIQTPVITGKGDVALASIDKKVQQQMLQDAAAPIVQGDLMPPLPKNNQSIFFNIFEQYPIEKFLDFEALKQESKENIPTAVIDAALAVINNTSNSDFKIVSTNIPAFEELKKQLSENPDAVKRFNKKLIEAISSRGQVIINQYLSGDEEEMERRRYYNTIVNDYGVYATMFDIALRISEPNTPLAKILKIKYHYFLAVSLRLKSFAGNKADSLLQLAFNEQMKALALEENAAYIQNDLGVLYKIKGDRPNAEKCFLKAADIAPRWVIPYSNLVSIYMDANQLDKALAMSARADSMQLNFHSNQVYTGMVYEKMQNYLLAEEYFRKSIALNSRHYLPFERLGNVYTQTADYFLADSFYYEAEVRKQGFNANVAILAPLDFNAFGNVKPRKDTCSLPQKINDNDAITYFVKGLQLCGTDDAMAEKMFKKVISIDKRHPLAFHYLGEMFWKKQRWQEADIYLKYAMSYHLDSAAFFKYCDSVRKYMTRRDTCIYSAFTASYYHRLDDYFMLADACEKWNHFAEAESLYLQVVKTDSLYSGAYYKLWKLYETLKRYHDAETVLLRYRLLFEDGLAQLNAFYRRVTAQQPANAEWYYKAGNFHYFEAMNNPDLYAPDVFANREDADLNNLQTDKLGLLDSVVLRSYDDYQVAIYGTGETTGSGELVSQPKRRSILYLLKADSLMEDAELRADINAKIGDMYIALHSTVNAFRYYKKSSALQGFNAGTRIKLIDAWDDNYYFREAKDQLDTLWTRNEINFRHLLLLGRYLTHASAFSRADTVLQKAKEIHPYALPEINDLLGRRFLMDKKYKEALPFFLAYLKDFPQHASSMYAVAKIYYATGNTRESYLWLLKAMQAGFNCYWVLKYDEIWNKERGSANWRTLTTDLHPKPFAEPETIILHR